MHRDSLDRYTNAQNLDMCVKLQHIRAPGWYGDRIRPMSPTPLDWCAQTRLDSKIYQGHNLNFSPASPEFCFSLFRRPTSVMHVSDHYIARGVPIDRQYSGGETGINIGKWNSISISDVVGILRNDQTITTTCHPRYPQPNYNDECGSNSFLFPRGCCLFIDLDGRKKVQGSKVVGICSTARLINRQVYFVPLLHILSLARALLLFVPYHLVSLPDLNYSFRRSDQYLWGYPIKDQHFYSTASDAFIYEIWKWKN